MALRILYPHISLSYPYVSIPFYFSNLCSGATTELTVGILVWRNNSWMSVLGEALESSWQTIDACYFWSLVTPERIEDPWIGHCFIKETKKQTKTEYKSDLISFAPPLTTSFSLGLWIYFWLSFKLLSSPSLPLSESLVSMLPLGNENLVMWAWTEQGEKISSQGVCYTLIA